MQGFDSRLEGLKVEMLLSGNDVLTGMPCCTPFEFGMLTRLNVVAYHFLPPQQLSCEAWHRSPDWDFLPDADTQADLFRTRCCCR